MATIMLRRLPIIIVVLTAFIGLQNVNADSLLTPHPALQFEGGSLTKQLGNFGESFVEGGFRARGFDVIDGNVGDNGIDRIAFRRSASGEMVDIRFIEIKTRQTVPDFKLAATRNNGPQLSKQWIWNNLDRIAREHPDANARRLAHEFMQQVKARPEIVRRELHGIAVEPDKYVVMNVDDAGRVTGVLNEGRLTSLLKMLSTRGESEETRAMAIRHLARFDQLEGGVAKFGPERPALAEASTRGLGGMVRQTRLPTGGGMTVAGTAVTVDDAMAATKWVAKLARQPGVLAAGVTFAVDEAFTGWEYYQGNISRDAFARQTAQNGIKASTVGIATQLVYILAPTPQGLVLIGVGIVAYIAADRAIAAYDAAFVPKAPAATELDGIIPAACIGTPMLGDVARGSAARPGLR
jgi:hypothetical protein